MDTLAEYLQYYGFKSEPFIGHGTFFEGAERKEAVEQIQHWCDFGAGIIVVEGESGLGKTCLLEQLLDQHGDGLVSRLDGPVLAGLDQMLMLLAAELGVELLEGQTSGAILGHIRQHVQKNKGSEMLVLVDQAEQFDDRALVALMSLLQGQQAGESTLNIVLFGDRGLADRLGKFDVVDVLVNRFELPAFNESETRAYIQQQITHAAYDGPELFSNAEIAELQKATKGYPAKINLLAQNLLINRLYSKPSQSHRFPVFHIFGIVALASVLAMAYVYRDEISEQFKSLPEEQAKQEEQASGRHVQSAAAIEGAQGAGDTAAAVNESSATEQLQDTESLINEALTPSEPAVELADDGSDEQSNESNGESTAEPTDESLASLADSGSQSEPAIDAQADGALRQELAAELNDAQQALDEEQALNEGQVQGDAGGAVQNITEQAAAGIDSLEAFSLSSVNENASGLIDYSSYSQEQLAQLGVDPAFDLSVFTPDEQYLLRLPDSAYVLQLIAVRTRAQVEQFLSTHPDPSILKIFNREREAKSWYVIVQPGFSTWEEVQAAEQRLPSRQRDGGAWPRSLKIIKADIRSFRGI